MVENFVTCSKAIESAVKNCPNRASLPEGPVPGRLLDPEYADTLAGAALDGDHADRAALPWLLQKDGHVEAGHRVERRLGNEQVEQFIACYSGRNKTTMFKKTLTTPAVVPKRYAHC